MRGLTPDERAALLSAKRALDTGEDQPHAGSDVARADLIAAGRLARHPDDDDSLYITEQGLGALICDAALKAPK